MRRLLTSALVLSVLTAPTAFAVSGVETTPALAGGQISAQGFDKCQAPPSSAMRSWLASPYRAVNIYFGGNNRACASQAELTPQWLTTVTSNGWSIIPTYVGSQAACTSSSKTHKIAASTAAQQGMQEADDAATQMQALGLEPAQNNPIYFDMEPYNRSNTTCDRAVFTFLDAWSRELIAQGYVPGVYGTTGTKSTPGLMRGLVDREGDPTFQEPTAIWYANWNGDAVTTDQDQAFLGDYFAGHRIHQYRGGHNETFSGQTFNIDNDAIDGDVVAAVTPTAPQGPPYHYAAAPDAGTTLKERSTPETTSTNKTGITYATGADLSIECQTIGEKQRGSVVWDRLTDGGYVSDIYTTTTGGLTFTAGIARCDTSSPVASMGALPVGWLHPHKTVKWSGTDDTAGALTYDVRYRQAAWNRDLGGYHRLLTATTETSALVPLAVGKRYCYDVRATDASGNVGSWSADSCIARAADDTLLDVGHNWRRSAKARYYQHTATATHIGGARAKLFGAHFSVIGIVATSGPKSGSIDVYTGHRLLGSISLKGPQHTEKQMFMLPAVSARVGNIRIVATTENALVRIDGIVVSG